MRRFGADKWKAVEDQKARKNKLDAVRKQVNAQMTQAVDGGRDSSATVITSKTSLQPVEKTIKKATSTTVLLQKHIIDVPEVTQRKLIPTTGGGGL